MATGGRYYQAPEFATTEEIVKACENDFAENQKSTTGCAVYFALLPILAIAAAMFAIMPKG